MHYSYSKDQRLSYDTLSRMSIFAPGTPQTTEFKQSFTRRNTYLKNILSNVTYNGGYP